MAKCFHMKGTNYNNPHGLSDSKNHSTAQDQAALSSYAMRNAIVRKIVSCKHYATDTYITMSKFTHKYPDMDTPPHYEGKQLPFNSNADMGVKYVKYPMEWHNSNRLLTVPGFSGVKTGITNTAGSCLSVYFDNGLQGADHVKLITVVLGSRNIEYRWKDTRRLTLWASEVLKYQKKQKFGEF